MMNTNSNYEYESGSQVISAKYLTQAKKKYNLAGIDTNVEKLKSDQIHELTKFLIDLKSEYDELIRETLRKKKDTEEIVKQIDMLEKMDKKKNDQLNEYEMQLVEIKKQIDIKKIKYEEELYEKETMSHLIERMKEENLHLQKKININENDIKRNVKEIQKQKLKSNEIKERLNQIHLKIDSQKKKNLFDRNENSLITQYYNAVIENKRNFIKAGDERKEKQKKIAQDAKNDTQDKQEVEKRKQYFLLNLFNRYLKRKIEKERKDNEKLEETFQNIKKITGISNIKQILDKIGNKDKNYNYCVSKVTQKETKIQILHDQIKSLEEEYIKLKNEAQVDATEDATTDANDEKLNLKKASSLLAQSQKLDKEEEDLIQEEKKLEDELNELMAKNETVELIYEKAIENILFFMKKSDSSLKTEESYPNESLRKEPVYSEQEILNFYNEFLASLKDKVENTFSKMTKEDFIELMRLKSEEIQKNTKKESTKKILAKVVVPKKKELENDEYNEEDEEDRELRNIFNEVLANQNDAARREKKRLEMEKEAEKKNK